MNWLENGEVLASIGEFLAEDIGHGDIYDGGDDRISDPQISGTRSQNRER